MSIKFKDALGEFAQTCIPSDVPWEQIRSRVTSKTNPKSSWISRHRKFVIAISGAAVVVGGTLGGAFLSPPIAVALDKTPIVNQVYDWFGDPGLNHAVGFDKKMHVSSFDRGITFTVTDVYYDQGRLAMQYKVSLPERMIGTRPVPPQMNLYVDGHKVSLPGMNTAGSLSDTAWQGMYEAINPTGLPKHFTMQMAIHKIGNVRGLWRIQVPVSGINTFSHAKTVTPDVSRSIDGTTMTVEDVTETPATIIVNYKYRSKDYTEKNPLRLNLLNGSTQQLRPISSQIISQHMTVNGSHIVNALGMFAAPKTGVSKSIKITPEVVSTNRKLSRLTIKVPLK